MFVLQAQSAFRNDFLHNSRNPYPIYNLIFRGTDHQNFCDVIHLTSRYLLTKPSSIGPNVNPNEVGEVLDRILVSFFAAIAFSKKFRTSYASIKAAADYSTVSSTAPRPSADPIILLKLLLEVKDEVLFAMGQSKEYMDEQLIEYLQRNLTDAVTTPDCFDLKLYESLQSNELSNGMIPIEVEV
jgi:hypothetical protein